MNQLRLEASRSELLARADFPVRSHCRPVGGFGSCSSWSPVCCCYHVSYRSGQCASVSVDVV
jgi:hypothetical protein